MSDITQALVQAVSDACTRHPAPEGQADGTLNAPLWAALGQIGITLLPIPEEQGGVGGDLVTTAAVLQELGKHAAAVPFAETALQAGWLLAESGAPIPDAPLAAAVAGPDVILAEDGDGWVLTGRLPRVPWARTASHVVVLVGRRVVQLDRDDVDISPGGNLAGEPRDDVVLDRVRLSADRVHLLPDGSAVDAASFAARGAVGRMALMAGAARRALEMSYGYASERHQFGRALFQFQSVQHQIAAMAGEALLCKVAAESAAQVLDEQVSWQLPVAAAKCAANEAAGRVAKIAHQVHGAIGFTEEHSLRRSTTAIWSWREEFGTSKDSATIVGELAAAAGADGLWSLLIGEKTTLEQ